MARRTGFYDDPAAPPADSLVPSVNVVVTNAAGDVLLIGRPGNQKWAVPGGAARTPGASVPVEPVPDVAGPTAG